MAIVHGNGAAVPEISRFFGIIVRMHYADHQPPHFHALYGGDEVEIAIDGRRPGSNPFARIPAPCSESAPSSLFPVAPCGSR